jgi:hypothetical protein
MCSKLAKATRAVLIGQGYLIVVINFMLQPLGLQQTHLTSFSYSLFIRQKLLRSCHNNLLIIVHLLGGLLVIFGG